MVKLIKHVFKYIMLFSFGCTLLFCGARQSEICSSFWEAQGQERENFFNSLSPNDQVEMYICSTRIRPDYLGRVWARKLAQSKNNVTSALLWFLKKNPRESSKILAVFIEMNKDNSKDFCDVDSGVLQEFRDFSNDVANEYIKDDIEIIIDMFDSCLK